MRRRTMLKAVALAPLALGAAGRLFAAPRAGAKLLVVFLRGGYDAANVLVPIASSFYYEARPNISIPRPAGDGSGALAIDADWGLHPALVGSVYPMFQAKQVAFVPFAGTENASRSHFDTQDCIELGQPEGRSRDYRSGFLNRLVAVLAANGRAMSFTDQLPIVFRGDASVANLSLRNLAKPAVDARQAEIIREMYRATRLEARVNEGFAVRDAVWQGMALEAEMASRTAITARGFELEARRIARLMADRYDVGFVDVGGWDTHVSQGATEGVLAGRIAELGRGLAGFADEMGPRWHDTVVVVLSEFGRTFRENGNRGTDHGHGSVYWVLGGAIDGGRVVGEQVRVERATVFENRDYPVLNEYRAMLSGLLQRAYGLDADQLRAVFPGVEARDLRLL
jgi:uncharacterized protein (DUF1501 family)